LKDDKRKFTTTDAGIPVASDEYSLTVGPDGPVLLQDRAPKCPVHNYSKASDWCPTSSDTLRKACGIGQKFREIY
jgi:hypothetical protein